MIKKKADTSTLQDIFRILIGVGMVYAALAHFTFRRAEFQAQVPDWAPFSKDLIVILSGVAELLLGLLITFFTKYKVWAGLALALFYIIIFPGNINQYINEIDAFGLDTDGKRLIRLFFQPILIMWALWSTGFFKAMKKPDL